MSAPPEALLVADSIGKRFGEHKVLSAATLAAHRGVVTALVGRNGSGKSTLLRIMSGLMAPDYGILRVRGRVYTRTRLSRMAREGLFLLPADRCTLSRTLTLRQHLDTMRRRFALPAADEVVEELKIAHLLDRYVGTYSGGERRRAELALALARAPEVLLADEPFLGITPADTELFIDAFRALARRGTAVVLTGHEVPFILAVADRVTWITAGTTRPLGDPEAARRDFQFRRDYLGTGAA
ncbi:MAG TPA: ATP-binding cassette domain-containing protein [Longimicrobium sp.]|uniref:ATP-binding cassette domain-containing protein n=1 Tax=Longimicrobium sp. TaxID=2029185 RepID=UPI002ED7AEBB